MMNLFLILAIVAINVVSIVIVCKILKKMSKKDIIIFLAVCVTIIYFAIQLIYLLSGIGIDGTIHNEMKSMIIFMFVPVDMIIFVPYIASKYIKLRNKDIKIEDLKVKIFILAILFIIISTIEFFYFRNIQQNTKQIGENVSSGLNNQVNNSEQTNSMNDMENTMIENTISNENIIENRTIDNFIVENSLENIGIQNNILENAITNSIVNNVN